jgi:molybdopterin-guanine dinucleotide biosynthesis protein A
VDEFEMVVVLGVDFPFMKPECLGWMVSQLRNAPAWNAVIPAPAGRSQPLTAVYTPNTIATFLDRDRALKGSIIEAMRGHSVKMLSDENSRSFRAECFASSISIRPRISPRPSGASPPCG